jgi:hypothetical protein
MREENRTGIRHRNYRVSWSLPNLRSQNERLRTRIRWLRTLPTWHPSDPVSAICMVWNPCGDALRVARCESGLSTRAQNGQYLGLFQMGSYARARYGHGSDAYTQAVAAHAYWEDAGWSPWTCAYLTGVI